MQINTHIIEFLFPDKNVRKAFKALYFNWVAEGYPQGKMSLPAEQIDVPKTMLEWVLRQIDSKGYMMGHLSGGKVFYSVLPTNIINAVGEPLKRLEA